MSKATRAHGTWHSTVRRTLLTAALVGLSIPVLAPASFAVDPVFEIEGNFVVDTEPNLDWESVLTGPVANDNSPSESTVFKTSSKENNAVSTWRDGNDSAPPKTDIRELYKHSRVTEDGELEFFFGWEREAPQGTLFYTLELNQLANVPGEGGGTDFTVPNRTAGDKRFSLFDQGNGLIELRQIDNWTGTAWECTHGTVTGCDGPVTPGAFSGRANTQPTTWPGTWNPASKPVPTDTFIETAFNLTDLIGTRPGCPGLTGYINFRSSTGATNSPTGENLKDYIKPIAIDGPNTCHIVTKSAAGTYNETHSWEVTKSVTPVLQHGFAGDTLDYDWTVGVDETVTEGSFTVSGQIQIQNPSTLAISAVVTDELNDASTTDAVISGCTNGAWTAATHTVVIQGLQTATCNYTVSPTTRSATLNTATVVVAGVTRTGTDPVEWTANVITPAVTLDDDQNTAFPTSVSDDGTFPYDDGYTCSTVLADYTNGTYTVTDPNTATIKDGLTLLDSASATATVICHAPVPGKTATGTYDETSTWEVTKSVAPQSQHAFAGDTVDYDWTVGVDETVAEDEFLVQGQITVQNPSSEDPMTAVVTDELNDAAGTDGVISGCTGGVGITWTAATNTLVVPASMTATCGYTAEPTGRTATQNTVTVTVGGLVTTASDPVEWAANLITPTVTLDDDQNPAFPTQVSADGTFPYDDGYTCSTNAADYTNGSYTFTDPNTATIKDGVTLLDSASATATVICHAPVVTKTADESFTRDWTWTIRKDFDAAYDRQAGETVNHDYEVTVTPTATDDDWTVAGSITIANSHPTAAMLLSSVTDDAGGVTAPVTCPPVLSVPAGGSLVCSYSTGAQSSPDDNPFGATNTATATFAGTGYTGTAPIAFPASPTSETDPVITVDDDNLTGESWTADRTQEVFTYDKDFTCPTSPASYTNGIHLIHHVNTATIVETDQFDTATVDVTCHQPQPGATLLIIDEDSIDNGIHYARDAERIVPGGPRFFSDSDVNDDKPGITQRDVLRFFAQNVGKQITVKTGQTGDEGWFAPNCIPQKWISGKSSTCLTGADRDTAIDNFFGGPVPDQSRLDKIPAVMPLRALGLDSLVGHDVCAVVYDSDISINYDKSSFPYTSGNLQGETLGVVAFHVDETSTLDGFSSSTLPQVTLTINNTSGCGAWVLFNAPVPTSSSVPNDRIAPGSPDGYRALRARPLEDLFY